MINTSFTPGIRGSYTAHPYSLDQIISSLCFFGKGSGPARAQDRPFTDNSQQLIVEGIKIVYWLANNLGVMSEGVCLDKW